jgi:GT2 family glycosyltransferase
MQQEKKQYIAVLITCHNRREKTLRCLDALYGCFLQEDYSFDVYLMDDGCTDGTGEAVRQQFPLVKIIQGGGNLYWNRGMRLGWETAAEQFDYDFYLWLNDDTYILSDTLKNMINAAIATNEQAIIAGSTCSFKTRELTYGGFGKNGQLLQPNGLLQLCASFNGNCVLIPSYVFARVGNLDPVFHHSIGDIDYGIRARKRGINLYTTCTFVGYCESHPALPEWCSPRIGFFTRMKRLYSPMGCNPFELFILDKRRAGLVIAIFHFVTVHCRALFPLLWLKKRSK